MANVKVDVCGGKLFETAVDTIGGARAFMKLPDDWLVYLNGSHVAAPCDSQRLADGDRIRFVPSAKRAKGGFL